MFMRFNGSATAGSHTCLVACTRLPGRCRRRRTAGTLKAAAWVRAAQRKRGRGMKFPNPFNRNPQNGREPAGGGCPARYGRAPADSSARSRPWTTQGRRHAVRRAHRSVLGLATDRHCRCRGHRRMAAVPGIAAGDSADDRRTAGRAAEPRGAHPERQGPRAQGAGRGHHHDRLPHAGDWRPLGRWPATGHGILQSLGPGADGCGPDPALAFHRATRAEQRRPGLADPGCAQPAKEQFLEHRLRRIVLGHHAGPPRNRLVAGAVLADLPAARRSAHRQVLRQSSSAPCPTGGRRRRKTRLGLNGGLRPRPALRGVYRRGRYRCWCFDPRSSACPAAGRTGFHWFIYPGHRCHGHRCSGRIVGVGSQRARSTR